MKKMSLIGASGAIALSTLTLGVSQAMAAGLPQLGRCNGSTTHCVIISNRNGNSFTPCIQAFDANRNPLSINDCSRIALNSVRRSAMPSGTTTATVTGKGQTFTVTFTQQKPDACFRYANDSFHEATDQPCTRS